MKEKGIINFKELFKGIAIVLLYPVALIIIAIPFSLLNEVKIINEKTVYLLTYLLVCIILYMLINKELKKQFKEFKKNFKKTFIKSLLIWLAGLTIMIISANLFKFISLPNVTNQESINEQFLSMPITEIIIACLLAPFIEEIIYRYSLRNFTKNKHLFAIITGIIFGLSHVLSSITDTNSLIMLLYLIPYGALGISLGYIYKEKNNIFNNISIHMLHNTISIIEIIIKAILGGLL